LSSGADRWRENWIAIAPPDAVRVQLPRGWPKRRLGIALASLQPGTPVVLYAGAPGAIRRCSSFVRRTGIEVEREYLAFPSAVAPAYLVEDAAEPARLFFSSVLTEPPRPGFRLLSAAARALLAKLAAWRGTRHIAPGRLVVGRLT
jgi:hypothetical protein